MDSNIVIHQLTGEWWREDRIWTVGQKYVDTFRETDRTIYRKTETDSAGPEPQPQPQPEPEPELLC